MISEVKGQTELSLLPNGSLPGTSLRAVPLASFPIRVFGSPANRDQTFICAHGLHRAGGRLSLGNRPAPKQHGRKHQESPPSHSPHFSEDRPELVARLVTGGFHRRSARLERFAGAVHCHQVSEQLAGHGQHRAVAVAARQLALVQRGQFQVAARSQLGRLDQPELRSS